MRCATQVPPLAARTSHVHSQRRSVKLFNGADGVWAATVDVLDKRQCVLSVQSLLRPQPSPGPEPVLLFALIKNARLPVLIEKATELGAARWPCQ